MKTELKNILLSHTHKGNTDIFDSQEYKDYIKNDTKTINLYRDMLSLFIAEKVPMTKKDIDYAIVGKLFMALILYSNEPNIELSDILTNATERELFAELKNIYNQTMFDYMQKSKKQKENIAKRWSGKPDTSNTKATQQDPEPIIDSEELPFPS